MRALTQAPGLEVTGVVGPGFDPDLAWQPGRPGTRPPTGTLTGRSCRSW
jgi:hypothetical protein